MTTKKKLISIYAGLEKRRKIYDTADIDNSDKFSIGLSEKKIRAISRQKKEPKWMLEKRLKGLELFLKTATPSWGPDLSKLDLDKIIYFSSPKAKESISWNDVPQTIKNTFDRLGIIEAEKRALSGVGAQYDSQIIYHNIQKELRDKGVIFENMDTALIKYENLVRKYFMTQSVPINDHKFAMLHAAVWSGGTFIYVPKGVKVDLPLQAYFRMNAMAGGQFEHTLIIADEGSEVQYIEGCSAPRYDINSLHAGCVEIFVGRNARVRYYSIENWSKNTYNLNTKRALVDENGTIEWVSGNLGSGTTMLYPCSILRGKNAKSDSLGIVFASAQQSQDTGAKVIHAAPGTTSVIRSKSISSNGGNSSYRGLVKITKKATNSSSSVNCDALLFGEHSISNTHPVIDIANDSAEVNHEAKAGKVGDEEIFYLMSKGLSEEEAIKLIVSGFIEPIVKALPMEYALELNKLVELEMEGSIG